MFIICVFLRVHMHVCLEQSGIGGSRTRHLSQEDKKMDKLVCRVWLVLLGIVSCEAFRYHKLYPGKYVLDVDVICNPTPSGEMEINVITDLTMEVTVICKNNFTEDIPTYDDVNFWFYPAYSGDPDSECVLDKKDGANQYSVVVETAWGEPGAEVYPVVETYLVTCTYDKHSQNSTSIQHIADGLIAPSVVQQHQGTMASSGITLRMVDALGRDITGRIPQGKLVKLQGHSDGAGGEQGLSALSCDAVGDNGIKYSIIRAGCGDGMIFGKRAGFITQGLDASSPYFAVFNVKGSYSMKFHCNFTVCSDNCDGTSCRNDEAISKRSADESNSATVEVEVYLSPQEQITTPQDNTDVNYQHMNPPDSQDKELDASWWQVPLVVVMVTTVLLSLLVGTVIFVWRQRSGSVTFT